ncbi:MULTISPECIES: CooT family nickel-binding protein [unclassified Methanoregula]|uniref:CooT family nickel-binding protein n=1 Tax=unclassified Methanoregula TaxID=2649730 RepID=UPI0009D31DB1|nr:MULTISPECIES: CooT family nickel-binding protein [unclassified Methanoregula]OPX61834.1 MAG: hypothetical protein A4E33_02713 [Methanoregula sp. PtaB.Bin085]OPY35080.1 MAG: hypothetical protein A4E34_01037 [Methanoregula sp. PtaU1.Bin006]
MCEFTVILEENNEKKEICGNVVKARQKDGTVIIVDASGSRIKVDRATIEVVDTLMQQLVLKTS